MPSFNSDHRDIPQPKAFHIILQFKYSRRDMSLTLGSIIQRQRNYSMNNLEETNIYQSDGPEPLHRKTMTLYLEKKMEKWKKELRLSTKHTKRNKNAGPFL